MISIYELKPRFQQWLLPLAGAMHRCGISANMVTVAAMILSVGYGALLLALPTSRLVFLLLPVFMFIRMALNAIDGMLARQFGQQSALGALLNEAGDVISDSALFLPFAFLAGVSAWLVVAVVLLSLLTEFVGVLGQVIANSRRYDGPMGKSDRAFVFGAIALLIGAGISLAPYLDMVFSAMCLLLVLCAWNRARSALRLSAKSAGATESNFQEKIR